MCTLSWVPHDGGYTLAFNRDERKTRRPGLPPSFTVQKGVAVLMPHDPDGGGSWISANARGHTLALLNRYEDTPHDDGGEYLSRGGLVSSMASLAGAPEVEVALGELELAQYRPFTLVSVGRQQSPVLYQWNGQDLAVATVATPGLVRSSSGSHQGEAEQARAAVFLALGAQLNGSDLMPLHRSHIPNKGPLSICMHRHDAETVSLSYITVNLNNLLMRYVNGLPCESSDISERSL